MGGKRLNHRDTEDEKKLKTEKLKAEMGRANQLKIKNAKLKRGTARLRWASARQRAEGDKNKAEI